MSYHERRDPLVNESYGGPMFRPSIERSVAAKKKTLLGESERRSLRKKHLGALLPDLEMLNIEAAFGNDKGKRR